MTESSQKKTNNQPEVHPVAIAISGAIFGAGAAIAGFMALKDEKNRKKVKKILVSTKDQIVDYLEELKQTAQEKQAEVEEVVEEEIEQQVKVIKPKVKKVKTAVKEIKKSVKKAAKK